MNYLGLMRFICLLLLCGLINANSQQSKMVIENKADIQKHQKILKETVKVDLEKLAGKHDELVDLINASVQGIRKYVQDSITELKTHLELQITTGNEVIMTNMKNFEVNTKEVIEDVIDITKTNLDTLNQDTMNERKWIVDWAHKRAHLHEDILKTKVMVCARAPYHFGTGTVTYSSGHGGFMSHNSPKEPGYAIQIYNYTCTNDACAKKILDRDTGEFIVPVNASGVYLFTFSIIMDTWDFSLKPSEFVFRKNKHNVEGTRMYSDVGSNEYSDMSMASRTIFLKLAEGDSIDVFQQHKQDSGYLNDYEVHFCGTLIHLEKASESPGGMQADSTHTEFPAPVESDLNDVTYKAFEFDDVTYKDFMFATKDTKTDDCNVDDKTAKIDKFMTTTDPDDRWDSTT